MHVTAPSAHSSMHTQGHSVGPPVETIFGLGNASEPDESLLRAPPSATSKITVRIVPTSATPAKIARMYIGIPPTVRDAACPPSFRIVGASRCKFHCLLIDFSS